MKQIVLGVLAGVAIAGALVHGQAATPFRLGTFERQGKAFVGVVLRDTVVIDLAAAHAAVQPASTLAAPADMKDLINRYDTGLRARIGDIVRSVNAAANARPAYVYDLSALKTLPPIMYPTTMLNVAVNYTEHGAEMAARDGSRAAETPQGSALPGTKTAPGIWERKQNDTRWNPYMFLKSPTAVIAHSESIQLPVGRTDIDWECELGVVIGRSASRVSAANAKDYIFGYTLENDVSDRGGRGDTRFSGSDWLIGKSHDTFAPLGPFIVPSEFVPNPQALGIKVILNGKVFQEGMSS